VTVRPPFRKFYLNDELRPEPPAVLHFLFRQGQSPA
jgi:hypothetical protein